MTTRQDISLDSGRDYGLAVSLFEADNTTPLNLVGCEVQWMITELTGSAALLAKSSLDVAEIEITGLAEGTLIIHLRAEDTEALGSFTGEHEMIVRDLAGTEATVMQGLMTIVRNLVQ